MLKTDETFGFNELGTHNPASEIKSDLQELSGWGLPADQCVAVYSKTAGEGSYHPETHGLLRPKHPDNLLHCKNSSASSRPPCLPQVLPHTNLEPGLVFGRGQDFIEGLT